MKRVLLFSIFTIAMSPFPVLSQDMALIHHELEGYASWYGGEFNGRQTANGEIFDTTLFTAAHKTLPFNTTVLVKNLENGKSVKVRINDRGPFVDSRIIDLSLAAAKELAMVTSGTAKVRLDILSYPLEQTTATIQIAAYSNKENADRARLLLAENGVHTVFEETSDGIIRLLLPEVPVSEVAEYRDILTGLGFTSILVRRN